MMGWEVGGTRGGGGGGHTGLGTPDRLGEVRDEQG